LAVIARLQNVDLSAAKHQFSQDIGSAYAAPAVAAKVLGRVAFGVGFWLGPGGSRRR